MSRRVIAFLLSLLLLSVSGLAAAVDARALAPLETAAISGADAWEDDATAARSAPASTGESSSGEAAARAATVTDVGPPPPSDDSELNDGLPAPPPTDGDDEAPATTELEPLSELSAVLPDAPASPGSLPAAGPADWMQPDFSPPDLDGLLRPPCALAG